MIPLSSLLLLCSLFGICFSKDRCFQSYRGEPDTDKPMAALDHKELPEQSQSVSMVENAGTGSATQIEMPDRAKRYQIRQRNYDID